ncbi:three-Cys-motif partner protein TcmP [bacterium]|nr:three-Cys-motif partner protein TcmP [bacterium]
MNAEEALNNDPRLQEALRLIPNISLDIVGDWTILKEQLLSYYMAIYNTILSQAKGPANKPIFTRWWIDACCSSGIHVSKNKNQHLPGSAYLATHIDPPFDKYIFIDEEEISLRFLHSLLGDSENFSYYKGDCNSLLGPLLEKYFQWNSYNRGLCFVDPYKININWQTIRQLGKAGKDNGGKGAIDCFINYPQHDIQRNIFRKAKADIHPMDKKRMTAFWGDDSWLDIVYRREQTLFEDMEFKTSDTKHSMLEAYKHKLQAEAGFNYTIDPFPLRNQIGVEVFYLFFATNAKTAVRAAKDAFKKFKHELK